nr:hypothetical protein [uncultured Dongia sp.]
MTYTGCRIWAPTTLLVAVYLIAIMMHAPARADGTACNRTAPTVAGEPPQPEPLHRCPKIGKKASHELLVLRGVLPFTDDEARAKAEVFGEFTAMCASGSARTKHIDLTPKDENGEAVWAYIAIGECL